jgi:hypothetical protein
LLAIPSSRTVPPPIGVARFGKEIKYTGHANFDAFAEQLRKMGTPSGHAYDLRVMFQAYVERGSTASQEDVAQFVELLGHEPPDLRKLCSKNCTVLLNALPPKSGTDV